VWWVIPVIIVYWPPNKCCSESKSERERSRSRTSSNSASGTGGIEHLVNEDDEDVFSSDEDNKSDFDQWASGDSSANKDIMYTGAVLTH
jgi:hypothetical protein